MAWQTFGHEKVKKILDLQLGSRKLPHAYLFFGPEGVGKKTLALEFAEKVLAQTERDGGIGSGAAFPGTLASHPDFALLDQEAEITTEQIQQFMEPLRFKPFRGQKKVAVVNNAHRMNTQSSNALLKTLEEPSASTVIILVSVNKGLLPTIISRCQVFSFNPFSAGQLEQFSRERQLHVTDEILALSFGTVGGLMALSDAAAAGERHKDIEAFERLKKSGEAERLLAVAEFSEREPQDLKKMFTSWLFWQRQRLAGNPGQFTILAELAESLRQLDTNKNKKLILQGLLLRL